MAKLGSRWEDDTLDLLDENDLNNWERIAPGVLRFRLPNNEPVRRIITGRRNSHTGALYSWKNGQHVAHESLGEEACARVLEVHPSVTSYHGQPEKLRIEFDPAGPIEYTPDFLVKMGHVELRIEYKRLVDLRPPRPKSADDERGLRRYHKAARMRARLRLVREAYDRAHVAWELVTDAGLAAMADKLVVDEIIANAGRPMARSDQDRLIDFLRSSPDCMATLEDCEHQLQKSEFPRGDVLARIPERLIQIDLFEHIGARTAVRLLEGAR